MADSDQDIASGGGDARAPALPPQLVDLQASLPEGAAQDWGADVANQVNDYLTQRTLAIRNSQIGQDIVDSVNGFTNFMSGIVKADPAATDMAVGVAGSTADALVNDHPYLDDAQKPELAGRLRGELQQNMARAGIMAAAQTNGDQAHEMLDKYRGLFPGDEVGWMRDHIDQNTDARAQDAQAAQMRDQVYAKNYSTAKLLDYAGRMVDQRGMPVPQPMAASSLNDQKLSPGDTAIAHALQDYTTGLGGIETGKLSTDNALQYLQGSLKGDAAYTPQTVLQNLVTGGQAGVQDGVLLAQVMRNPDDARALMETLNAAKLRVTAGDGTAPSGANAARLDQFTHDLLVRYSNAGAQAFEGLPRLGRGGFTTGGQTFAQRADSDARLSDIFNRAENRSAYTQRAAAERRAFDAEKFRIEMQYRMEHDAETRKAQADARAEAARVRAQERADRLNEAAANRQARAQEAAARLAETRAARQSRDLGGARRPARQAAEPSALTQFRRGARLVRNEF